MALPTSMQFGLRGRYSGAGITVEIYPSTVRGLSVELQYSTANSTATSVWQKVSLNPSSVAALRYTIPVQDSTRLVFMKARHPAQAGYSAGAFTPTISARAKLVPHIQPPITMQMTYQGNVEAPSGSDVFVSSGKTVKVGTQVTTGTVEKSITVSALEGFAESSTQTWAVSGSYVRSGSTRTLVIKAPIILSPGAQVTAFSARGYRETTADSVQLFFQRASSNGGTINLSSGTQATTGWITTTGSAIAHTISTQFSYHVRADVNPATTANNARFLWWQIVYEMTDYQKAI